VEERTNTKKGITKKCQTTILEGLDANIVTHLGFYNQLIKELLSFDYNCNYKMMLMIT
jgi:hypothetical protein